MGSEVAVPQGGGIAELQRGGALGITAEDIAIPRLYIGQAISKAVEEGLVKSGAIFVAQDETDPDPVTLCKPEDPAGVDIHVLDLRKGISRSIDGVLETWAPDDPTAPVPCKETGAWWTYTYFVAIPSHADDIPFRWLLSRSGQPAAQSINTRVLRSQDEQPVYEHAFRITTVKRANKKGQQYYVPRVAPVEATSKALDTAKYLSTIVQANQARVNAAHAADAADPTI